MLWRPHYQRHPFEQLMYFYGDLHHDLQPDITSKTSLARPNRIAATPIVGEMVDLRAEYYMQSKPDGENGATMITV